MSGKELVEEKPNSGYAMTRMGKIEIDGSWDTNFPPVMHSYYRRLIFMAVTTKRSQTLKPSLSDGPRPLTKQEIESLRRNRKEGHIWFQKKKKKMNLIPLR
jgi:hypothetical protein